MNRLDLVILAGGKGTRIKKYLNKNSKPMIKFFGYYFIDLILSITSKFLFKNIYILAGYRGDQIKKYYNNKKINLSKIKVLVEKEPKGTGGALMLVKKKIKNDFFLVNGDSIFDINFLDLIPHIKNKSIGSIALVKNKNYKQNKKLSSLDINKKNKKVVFKKNSKFMNGGVYFFKKKFLTKIKKNKFSLENDLLKKLIKENKINGKIFNNFFIDIGTPKNLMIAKKVLKKQFFRPAIFLDRDGVLNYDKGYTHKVKDLRLIHKTIKFLKKKRNFNFFVVTNQSGIGRGIYNEDRFYEFQNILYNKLLNKKIYINDTVFCPHHPDSELIKFKLICRCRKPKIGMIEELKKRWFIDFKNSLFIGDSLTDELAAKKSKVKFINIQNIKN